MRAIETKYRGPVSLQGTKILVYDEGKCVMRYPYQHQAQRDEVHRMAARAYCDRMGWTGTLVDGEIGDGGHHVFVWLEDRATFAVPA